MYYEIQTPDKVVQGSINEIQKGIKVFDLYLVDQMQSNMIKMCFSLIQEMQSFQDYRKKQIDNGTQKGLSIHKNYLSEQLDKRSLVGIEKYGTTLQDANLTKDELLQHALEECLDLINYLEALKSKINQ